jgi:hypothetical protein
LGKRKVSCSCWNPYHGQDAQDGGFRGIIKGGVRGLGEKRRGSWSSSCFA